jgi:hypothetical protein
LLIRRKADCLPAGCADAAAKPAVNERIEHESEEFVH